MVCYIVGQYLAEIQLFETSNLRLQKNKSKYWKIALKFPNEVLSNAYYWTKIKFWYIYSKTFTKYLHGKYHYNIIILIFGINKK